MNRAIIDETALKLFREHGFDAVRVRDICDACHITKPTFYHYVPSKDDLLITYYNAAVDALESSMEASPDADAWTQICTLYGVLIDEAERIGFDLLSRVLAINLEADRRCFERKAHLTDNMVAIIRRGQERGELSNSSNPELLHEASVYLLQGYELLWCTRKGEMDWRAQFMQSLETLMLPKGA